MASGGARLRRVFVVAQVALSLTLLVVAGLFLQSLSKAMRVDPISTPTVSLFQRERHLHGNEDGNRLSVLEPWLEPPLLHGLNRLLVKAVDRIKRLSNRHVAHGAVC
jgi:hypothetical protein